MELTRVSDQALLLIIQALVFEFEIMLGVKPREDPQVHWQSRYKAINNKLTLNLILMEDVSLKFDNLECVAKQKETIRWWWKQSTR